MAARTGAEVVAYASREELLGSLDVMSVPARLPLGHVAPVGIDRNTAIEAELAIAETSRRRTCRGETQLFDVQMVISVELA